MWLALTAIAALALGYELTRRIWSDGLLPVERAAFSFLLGLSAWIASTWILALGHLLVTWALVGRTIVFAAVAAVLLARRRPRRLDRRRSAALLALLPIAAWLVFILWRGAIVPPLTH